MYNHRFNLKKLSLWILVLVQVFVIASYYYVKKDEIEAPINSVTFIKSKRNVTRADKLTYHTERSLIVLKDVPTRENFTDFNTSLCYTNGTDLKGMKRTNDVNWKCSCLPGWHGTDCSQPEVIWRAFLAYRKPVSIKGPRKYQRRIIYAFEFNEYTETLTDIRVDELSDVVNLFVLYEIDLNDYLEKKLNSGYLKKFHYKILFLKIRLNEKSNLLSKMRKVIRNIKEDDLILTSGTNEIPNKLGVAYFKFYNGWPEPISFRLKYSVYGFFWMHPSKTILSGGAATVRYLNEILNDDLTHLSSNKTLSNLSSKNFIIGDLNHYGGWFCEFCAYPPVIVKYLKDINFFNDKNGTFAWDKVNVIDNNYIENLIENGVYIDGKTNMIRAHKYRENYFAPFYTMENTWKYDFLLVNMFSNADYYD